MPQVSATSACHLKELRGRRAGLGDHHRRPFFSTFLGLRLVVCLRQPRPTEVGIHAIFFSAPQQSSFFFFFFFVTASLIAGELTGYLPMCDAEETGSLPEENLRLVFSCVT